VFTSVLKVEETVSISDVLEVIDRLLEVSSTILGSRFG
jgi:hypothetical protein